MDLASSVAGLIGLAGLVVQSASTLYTFCHKIPRVAGEVEAIVNEIGKLNQSLESIRHAIADRATQKLSPRSKEVVTKIREQVKQCTSDLDAWNSSMTALRMNDGKWVGNAIKKLKLAADAGRFLEIRGKISAHRDQLVLLVELLTVGLEMSTSQVIDGIDSKIDNFTAEQTSNQTLNINYLEKIQEGVQAAATLQSTTQVETSNVSKATESMRQVLQDIQTSQATSHQMSLQQAQKLDGVLYAIQTSLLNVTTNNCPRPKTRRSRKSCYQRRTTFGIEKTKGLSTHQDLSHDTSQSSIAEVQLNRVVDLAFTVRYRCGEAQFKPIAVPDPVFEEADWETKLRMVKYLQDLRLLLWLLRRDTYSVNGLSAFRYSKSFSSYYISESSLVSSWMFCWARGFVYKHSYEMLTPMCKDDMYVDLRLDRYIRSSWLVCPFLITTESPKETSDQMLVKYCRLSRVWFRFMAAAHTIIELLESLRCLRAVRLMVGRTQLFDPISQDDTGEIWKTCLQNIRGYDVIGEELRSMESNCRDRLSYLEHHLKQHNYSIPNQVKEIMKNGYPATWASRVLLSADWAPVSDTNDEVDLPWPNSHLLS